MKKSKHRTSEQKQALVNEVAKLQADGASYRDACRQVGAGEQSLRAWQKKFSAAVGKQAKRQRQARKPVARVAVRWDARVVALVGPAHQILPMIRDLQG